MSCENPIRLKNPRYRKLEDEVYWRYHFSTLYDINLPDEYIDVPCGRCLSCRKSKSNSWRIRLLGEYSQYPNSLFITLTFDETNLLRFKDNPNKAVRLFLDRMRKTFDNKSIRHFIIGEYGDRTSRFHYHGILFNVPKKLDKDVLESLWSYGWVYLGWCTQETIHYILKYLTKIDPLTNKQKKIPRLIVSKGIGSSLVDEYKESPMKHNLMPLIVSEKGYKIPLPRYIKSKLYTLDEQEQMIVNNSQRPIEKYLDGVKYLDINEYKKKLKEKFEHNVQLGVSERIERKHYSEIEPLKMSYISPFDDPEPISVEILNSNFEVEQIPF